MHKDIQRTIQIQYNTCCLLNFCILYCVVLYFISKIVQTHAQMPFVFCVGVGTQSLKPSCSPPELKHWQGNPAK